MSIPELCDRLFEGLAACGITAPAPDDRARQKTRHQTSCVATLGLPGTSQTPMWLQGCIAALEASSCDPTAPPVACEPGRGAFPDGAHCNESTQCQSGVCYREAHSQNAGLVVDSCGTCATTLPEGAPCTGADVCAPGTACNYALAPNRVCQAFGDVGTACSKLTPPCKSGLSCFITDAAAETGSCVRPSREGGPCSATSCVAGLICDSVGKTCVKPKSWVKAGQPCDAMNVCEVGACVYTSPTAKTCSAIVPEGQSCVALDTRLWTTCDTSAYCVDGACTIIDTKACPVADAGAKD